MPSIPKKQPHRAYLPEKTNMSIRKVDNSNFYNSTLWRKVSRIYRTNNPLCEASETPQPADVVDHIIPISQGGAKYDNRNLMSLCHEKHNRKSGKEAHEPALITWQLNEKGYKIPVNREDIIKILK